MRSLNLIFILSIISLLSCTSKTTKPLKKVNFQDHNWKLVYIEDQTEPNTYKLTQNIWLINDTRTLDLYRNEYKCNLDKLGDGEKEYQIYIFKDNENYDWVCFNSEKNFQLGNLKHKLHSVNTSYYYFPNLHTTQIFADSLSKQNIIYTISPTENGEKIDEFALKINLYINWKSKLLKGMNPGYYDCNTYAKEELKRLFPELDSTSYKFIEYRDEYGEEAEPYTGGAPGDLGIGRNEFIGYLRNEQKILVSSKTFDIDRLKNTDLFSKYEICTLYILTIYQEK